MKTTLKLLIAQCKLLIDKCKLSIAHCTLLIANCSLFIAHYSLSQGSIDIDTNIQMGIAGNEHVKITTNNFSIHQDAASPLIYGDFGSGNVGIGTDSPVDGAKVDISGIIAISGQKFIQQNTSDLIIGDLHSDDGNRGLIIRAGDQDRIAINQNGKIGVGLNPTDSEAMIEVLGIDLPVGISSGGCTTNLVQLDPVDMSNVLIGDIFYDDDYNRFTITSINDTNDQLGINGTCIDRTGQQNSGISIIKRNALTLNGDLQLNGDLKINGKGMNLAIKGTNRNTTVDLNDIPGTAWEIVGVRHRCCDPYTDSRVVKYLVTLRRFATTSPKPCQIEHIGGDTAGWGGGGRTGSVSVDASNCTLSSNASYVYWFYRQIY